MLAFRVWRVDRARLSILSLNAPMPRQRGLRPNAVALALASEPSNGWPADKLLEAECARSKEHKLGIPDKDCTCGIYATTSMDVVDEYLRPDAPILGVVELGGRVIPATQGFRARFARLAAVLLVDPVLTIAHSSLQALADKYRVPALVPHSIIPEEYRDRLATESLVGDIEEFLRGQH
jgi:hypothetical protein